MPPGAACHSCKEGKVKCTYSRLDSETLKDFEVRLNPEEKTVASTSLDSTKLSAGYSEWHVDEAIIVEPFGAIRDDDMQHPCKRSRLLSLVSEAAHSSTYLSTRASQIAHLGKDLDVTTNV